MVTCIIACIVAILNCSGVLAFFTRFNPLLRAFIIPSASCLSSVGIRSLMPPIPCLAMLIPSFHPSAMSLGIHLPSTLIKTNSPFSSSDKLGRGISSIPPKSIGMPPGSSVIAPKSGLSGKPLTLIVASLLFSETTSTFMLRSASMLNGFSFPEACAASSIDAMKSLP